MKTQSHFLLFLVSAVWAGWIMNWVTNWLTKDVIRLGEGNWLGGMLLALFIFGILLVFIGYLGKKFAWNRYVLLVLLLIPALAYCRHYYLFTMVYNN
jgi:hypothetical protein